MSDTAKSDQDLEARIQAYVGLDEGPAYTCPDAVNEAMIRHWCEAMGDANPAYLDAKQAAQTVHRGLVAPPAMLQVWDMRGYPMHDPRLLPANQQRELHAVFDAHGYIGVVATDTEQEYRRYLRPGDRVTAHTVIESISGQKTTALGVGYFIVTRTRFRDQRGEEVGSLSFRVLKFRPNQPAAQPGAASGAPAKPRRIRSPRGFDNAWWWEACDQGKLLIQKCTSCGALRHPPRPMCGKCQSSEWQAVPASGRGRVHSYTVLHHPPIPGYELPLPIGLIDLEEGTRLVANIAGCTPEAIRIGMRVECLFEDVDESMKLPFFYPVN